MPIKLQSSSSRARIPDATELGALPSALPGGVRASIRVAVPTNTDAVGRGLERLGQGITGLAEGIERFASVDAKLDRERDGFDTEMQFQQFEFSEILDNANAMETLQPNEARGFSQRRQDVYVERARTFYKGVPEHLRVKYEEKLFGLEKKLFLSTKDFETRANTTHANNAVSDNVNNIYIPAAGAAKTSGDVGEIITAFDRQLSKSPDLNPFQKEAIRRKHIPLIVAAYLRTKPPDERIRLLAGIRKNNWQLLGKTSEGRAIVWNPDTQEPSSEISITIEDPRTPGKWINIPSLYGGKPKQPSTALEIIQKAKYKDPETGRVIKSYFTMEEAELAARARSDQLGEDPGVRRVRKDLGQQRGRTSSGMIRKFEAYSPTAYLDSAALPGSKIKPKWRIGYGSDEITREDGTIIKVTQGMRITRADAARDLERRSKVFSSVAEDQVGDEAWAALTMPAREALVSVAYNHGSLPGSVVKAVRTGDIEQIAGAVERLPSNPNRRRQEAAAIRGAPTGSIMERNTILGMLGDKTRQVIIKGAQAEIKAALKAEQIWRAKLQTVLVVTEKARDSNPSGIAMERSADHAAALNTLMQTIFGEGGDDENTAEIIDMSIKTIRESQSKWGIRDKVIKILPIDQAKAIVRDLETTDREKITAKFNRMKERLGKHWVPFHRELTQQGLAGDYTMQIILMDGTANGLTDMATAAAVVGIKEADLMSKPGTDFRTLQNTLLVDVDNALKPWIMAYQFGIKDRITNTNDILQTIRKIALREINANGNAGQALKRATNLLLSRYLVINEVQARMVIPNSAVPNPERFSFGLSLLLTTEKLEKFGAVISDPFSQKFLEGPRAVKAAVGFGIWKNDPNGLGVVLMHIFKDTSEVGPVYNKAGNTYFFTWAEVDENRQRQIPNPDQRRHPTPSKALSITSEEARENIRARESGLGLE